ncbi:fatty acid desaturase [bacterium]|nr:fatty acid desaturase [bacterium]
MRNRKDIQSLFYAAAAAGVLWLNWHLGASPWLVVTYPLALLLAFLMVLVGHNHAHLPLFYRRPWNRLASHYLAIFYGHPLVIFIPVHLQNHHKHRNTDQDWTATYKVSDGKGVRTLLAYHFHCSRQVMVGYGRIIRRLYSHRPGIFRDWASYYAVFLAVNGLFLLINPWKAFFFLILPGQLSIFFLHTINFIQHVSTDSEDDYRSSRDFVSPWWNTLLLNAGFHTVHHLHPSAHWSEYPAKHSAIAHKLDSNLIEADPFSYTFRKYLRSRR